MSTCLSGVASSVKNFGEDVAFLQQHTRTFVLGVGHAKIAVAPDYQARVMTSTATGDSGIGLGWINHDLIASGESQEHIHVYGGEERFWLGPEGGQFAIFFEPDAPYTLEHWQTPAPIDTDVYELVSEDASTALLHHRFAIANRAGFTFHVDVNRKISVGSTDWLDDGPPPQLGKDTNVVVYRTENDVTNVGDTAWSETTGLLAIWILGMYKPSPETKMIIPVVSGPESELGMPVNDLYFGKVPGDRLAVRDDVIYFRGDGRARGKIGVSPVRSKGKLGSFDPSNGVLTVVTYNVPDEHAGYVNNLWEDQKEPFAGDAIMAYNDGPPVPGADPLGPFYELETSSPALPLAPGQSYRHVHTTAHFVGDCASLDALARRYFGVGLDSIEAALD